ncbi:hypothetical protein [Thermoflavimicrobium dichotomicum]|uniref:Uncharacterized protein n=1 Tax=Thermoflavimicrobium dichotomicum TaxID=46223 RepID=A0A1I3ME34_9BACL|nr:hypothetical protein [Thermoflavimicrobium dichotomicum]SFI95207.1 hypothetical protein SAMN05421852_10328 [Thermoflavimicrobium dichotomicum]
MPEMPYEIKFDPRLKIDRPYLHVEYEQLPKQVQEEFELKCQEICSQIPDRIKSFEKEYMKKYEELKEADEDEVFFQLTDELNEISSCICDLNLLFLHIEGAYISHSVHA